MPGEQSLRSEYVSLGGNAGVVIETYAAREPVSTALFIPAMGVRASYYGGFASRLSDAGVTVVVADLRGQGESTPPAGRATDHGFATIVENDLPRLVEHVRTRNTDSPIWLMGHSLGGQLALVSVAHSGAAVAGVALIACGSAHYRAQGGWHAYRHALLSVVFAGVSRAIGYWPGDQLHFGGRQSARLMIDITRQTLSGSYRMPDATSDYEEDLGELRLRVVVVDIEGDNLTPEASTSHLCTKAASASVERHVYPMPRLRSAVGNHFAWVRNSPGLAEDLARWMTA